MNKFKTSTLLVAIVLSFVTIFTSCKSKKLATPAPVEVPVVVEAPKVVEPVKVEADTDGDGIVDSKDNCPNEKGTEANNGCPAIVEKPFEYKNIQFEFNSSVLKTSSYAVLEELSTQIKKNPTVVFELDGHSSAEGTEKRNLMLSVDRANAVKAYLVNSGINGASLIVKGFGESMPLVANDTEENKSINRRVEVKAL